MPANYHLAPLGNADAPALAADHHPIADKNLTPFQAAAIVWEERIRKGVVIDPKSRCPWRSFWFRADFRTIAMATAGSKETLGPDNDIRIRRNFQEELALPFLPGSNVVGSNDHLRPAGFQRKQSIGRHHQAASEPDRISELKFLDIGQRL